MTPFTSTVVRLPALVALGLAAVGADMGEARGVEDVEGVVYAVLPAVGQMARRRVDEVEARRGDGARYRVRRAEEGIGRVLAARAGQAGDQGADGVVRAGDELGQRRRRWACSHSRPPQGLAVEAGVHDDVAADGQRGRREFGGSGGLCPAPARSTVARRGVSEAGSWAGAALAGGVLLRRRRGTEIIQMPSASTTMTASAMRANLSLLFIRHTSLGKRSGVQYIINRAGIATMHRRARPTRNCKACGARGRIAAWIR